MANSYSNGSSATCASNPTLTTVQTTNDAGQVSKVSYTYDQYGNVTDEKDYDWGAITPLRELVKTYWYQQNSAYSANTANLVHLPWYVTTKDGAGNQAAVTTLQYDGYPLAVASGVLNHDSGYNSTSPTSPVRGNLNYVYNWVSGSTQLGQSFTYDTAGDVLSHGYDNGSTTYSYNGDGTGHYAFPTTVKDGAGKATAVAYDYYVGKPTSVTDANGNKTSYQYADAFDRVTQMTEPTGALTNMNYASPTWVITTHSQTSATDGAIQSQVVSDGFGRDIEDRQFSAAHYLIAVDHGYDALGRMNWQSNPSQVYIPNWTTDGLAYQTFYSFDSINRLVSVTAQDQSVTTTAYAGNVTTVTDAASKATATVTDALGRATFVYEDVGAGSNYSNLQTQYSFDALGDLTKVVKCVSNSCGSSQSRTFAYDGLGRLTQAQNVESGTVSYSYSLNGTAKQTLQSRTDNRGSGTGLTTYSHDADNRLTGVTYNDGTPAVSYTFDAVGNLKTAVSGGVTNSIGSYDADNRPLTSSVAIGGNTYGFIYTYDLAGELLTETYPSGRVVTNTYDVAMRPTSLKGALSGLTTNYVPSVTYWPHGAVNVWQYGNNVWPVATFNKVLEPYETYSTIGNNPNDWLLYIVNTWNTNGTLGSVGEFYGNNVTWANFTQMGQTFSYDHLNRLTNVTDTNYSHNYGFDAYGNMSVTSYSSGAPGISSLTPLSGQNPFNAANNRLISATYNDARGNMTAIGAVSSMGYDGESRQTQVVDSGQTVNYAYDGMGQRVQRQIVGGATSVYVHDAYGNLAAEYNSGGITVACQTCYLSYDHLGSVRLITDQGGSVIARHDYVPFGGEIQQGVAGRSGNGFGSTAYLTQMFTGQERDGGTAMLDYFNARHLSAYVGSFVQADPGNAGANVMNPQSWNGYGYVLGNPLGLVDPSGMFAEDGSGCFSAEREVPCDGFPVDGGFSGGKIDIHGGGGRGSRGGSSGAGSDRGGSSFLGGETLGLPSGVQVPGPFGIGQQDPLIINGILQTAGGNSSDLVLYAEAIAYLEGDPTMARIIRQLRQSRKVYTVSFVKNGDDSYFRSRVTWDPTSSLRTTQGGCQSAALGLGHEFAHAYEQDLYPDWFARESGVLLKSYGNAVERWAITGPEASAAQTLGEPRRYNHGGVSRHDRSATSRNCELP